MTRRGPFAISFRARPAQSGNAKPIVTVRFSECKLFLVIMGNITKTNRGKFYSSLRKSPQGSRLRESEQQIEASASPPQFYRFQPVPSRAKLGAYSGVRSTTSAGSSSASLTGGAVMTALLFVIGKWAARDLSRQRTTASPYGAASSLIMVLLWIYYSSQILLFGDEFAQVYTSRCGARTEPENYPVRIRAQGN